MVTRTRYKYIMGCCLPRGSLFQDMHYAVLRQSYLLAVQKATSGGPVRHIFGMHHVGDQRGWSTWCIARAVEMLFCVPYTPFTYLPGTAWEQDQIVFAMHLPDVTTNTETSCGHMHVRRNVRGNHLSRCSQKPLRATTDAFVRR
jgi:hypothetical protein